MFSNSKSAAAKRYRKTVLVDLAAYAVLLWAADSLVRAHRLTGWMLFVPAALPCAAIVGLLVAVGLYLRDEVDEYQRNLTVKSLLWGTGTLLALTTFCSFLRSFGWDGSPPPFTELACFWVTVTVAKLCYQVKNQVPADA